MFTILCCADIAGEKVNLEITLKVIPSSVRELADELASVFAREAQQIGAAPPSRGVWGPLEVASLLIYDDGLLRWTKLKALGQLHEYDQLYIFQPQTENHTDTQQALPPPRPPTHGRTLPICGGPPPRFSTSGVDNDVLTPRNEVDGETSSAGVGRSAQLPDDRPSQRGLSRSPLREQLEEQRKEEARLAQRLSTVRSERERLEREAQREEEEERRRRALEADEMLKRKEKEIWARRDALAKAEEEYQLLLTNKERLVRQSLHSK